MPYSPCAALDPDTASFSPTSSHFFYYDNFGENAVLNATPCAHDISTPDLSEIDLGDNNAHNLTDCSDNCDGCVLNTEKNFDSTFLSQKYISGTNSTVCNFEEIGLLNTSPSMHDISTPALSQFSDNGDTNSITNISELSSLDSFLTNMEESKNEDSDPLSTLNNIRISNIDRLIIGQLNINSLRNKFEALKHIVSRSLDILIVTETKIDESFPDEQFFMDGYWPPFRADRDDIGGGVIIYVREDIACSELKNHTSWKKMEGIFIELNLRKSKWLLFGGYNPKKENIAHFLKMVGAGLDHYMPKYDNFLLLGDFNSEMCENAMKEFCDTYNLTNLIKEPTCFKNPLNPSTIDLILTNRPRSFQNSKVIETGLSDHHKLTISVMKTHFPKQDPITISYRDFKHYDQSLFRYELLEKLNHVKVDADTFEKVLIPLVNRHAPLKEKCMRANNAPFMNKTLSKVVMTRSRLRNKFLMNPNNTNKSNYTKYRNYCTRLFKKEKKLYYNNLDTKSITDNKKFWKTVKPLFSDKHFSNNKITLVEGDDIISADSEVAETFNNFFTNAAGNLNIEGFETDYDVNPDLDKISNIIEKFKIHPSILKIKENVKVDVKFNFSDVNESVVKDKVTSLDKKKPTTFNNIPARILVENSDIISPYITDMLNVSKSKADFPFSLKLAEITPAHKKNERTLKNNYRPVSILPSLSKIFERNMYDQISGYVDKYLSPFLCGFRKGFSTQQCLILMLERWKKAMDSGKLAGALLTDLSKAFDCINHELLIAKLEAYGFDINSLTYIYSYLSDRKQRTKVNNSFSTWSDIILGVPQGSILGPLLFNIYLNDIFYFVQKCDIANYADDTTPYATEKKIDALLESLWCDTSILNRWFKDNYLQMNPDKCHLLVCNHDKDVSIILDNEVIDSSESVKLLGITIDRKLDFNEHVSKICKKVSSKLHALARVANLMSQEKLRLLMKSFIESQFSYCPLVWMFHSRTLNNRINRLHKRALRLVYKDSNLTFDELLRKDNSFSIHHRNLQKLATEMYKVHNNLSPDIMKYIFPRRSIPYNLRKKNDFLSSNVHSVSYGTETISFRGPKTWALVPEEIQNASTLLGFKTKIRGWEPKGCTCRLCKTYIYNLGFI